MVTLGDFMSQIHSSQDFANPTALEGLASMAAADYFGRARREIDEEFGEGYAKEHPELVAAFMQVAAMDFATAMLTKAIMYHGEKMKDDAS